MTTDPVALTPGTARSLGSLAAVTVGNRDPREAVGTEDAALRRVATEFEAIFLGELLKSMRSTQLESGLFGKDRSTQMYREMHDDAMARELATAGASKDNPGGLGIGRMLYEELGRSAHAPVHGRKAP